MRANHRERFSRLLLVACLPLAAVAGEQPVSEPGEVLVTGERLPRTLAATASSVAVTTGADIDSLAGGERLENVLALVPNLQAGSAGEGPTIRGQDSTGVLRDLPGFLGGSRPRTTLQVDGRAVGFNEFVFGVAPVWDVDRIEVFRSPQTTTQGRNAIGGAIFIATREPEFAWHARARGSRGNLDSWQGSFAVTGPLIDQQLAFRIAADTRTSRSATRMNDVIDGGDLNDDEYDLVRLKLLAEPHALPGARLAATYTHIESKTPQIEGIVAPFALRRDPTPGYGAFANTVDSLTGVFDYAISPTAHSKTTLSWGNGSIRRLAPAGLGQSRTQSRDHSIESVLSGELSGSLGLLAGFHVLDADLAQRIDLSAVLGAGDFSDAQHSRGVFAELSYRLAPTLLVTTGLRYQHDSQERAGRLGTAALSFPIDFDASFDAWLPKLTVTYESSRNARVGVLIQRAYNPGGTTLNLETGRQIDFGAEWLWNYELFSRLTLNDGAATLATNLFYNDARDAQRARSRAYGAPGGATAFWAEISNVPAAESYGAEFELSARLTAGLSVRTGLGLLHTRIRDREFQRAPALTSSAAVDWRISQRWRMSAQYAYHAAYFSDDLNTRALRIGGNALLDVRAAYATTRWSAFAYVRNALDKLYLTTLTTAARGAAGSPRQYGFGVELTL